MHFKIWRTKFKIKSSVAKSNCKVCGILSKIYIMLYFNRVYIMSEPNFFHKICRNLLLNVKGKSVSKYFFFVYGAALAPATLAGWSPNVIVIC